MAEQTNGYITAMNSDSWLTGYSTYKTVFGKYYAKESTGVTNTIRDSTMGTIPTATRLPDSTLRKLYGHEQESIGPIYDIWVDDTATQRIQFSNAYWDDAEQRAEFLNDVSSYGKSHVPNIQNAYSYPSKVTTGNAYTGICTSYDYQTHVESNSTMQTMLMNVRAAFGINAHGEKAVSKGAKLYLYNRWKRPDSNLAHNRTFTHIFFTRPDCNLLTGSYGSNQISQQAAVHSDSSLIWRRHPELFRLLVDSHYTQDRDNFNLLLSNQVTNFTLTDDNITHMEAGKSWAGSQITYGGEYTGIGPNEFTCTFEETSDYSISNLMRLWVMYISNVSRGVWSPSYNRLGADGTFGDSRGSSHVFTKTLDYASSAYVFKVGPDGEDILYFAKYYGIFPLSSGSSAHSWNIDGNIGDSPKLNITFRYSFKKEMNPTSLLEFNHNSMLNSNRSYDSGYDENMASSTRAYVGTPFVEMVNANNGLQNAQMVNRNVPEFGLRLKFAPVPQYSSYMLSDDNMFKARF